MGAKPLRAAYIPGSSKTKSKSGRF
jgi:hypothetical protein